MNWKTLLLRDTASTELPFDVLVKYLKRKTAEGVRFKAGYIDKEDIDVYYGNDYAYGGYAERLGLDRVPTMRVVTNNKMAEDGRVTIRFQAANFMLIVYGVIALLIVGFTYFRSDIFGPWVATPILVVMYLLILNDFTTQLFYFKHELNVMEKDFKMKLEHSE